LAGLRETVIDTQKNILDAAVQANVQRFIQAIIQPILQT
jgi:nucleoside-diphosphate-sugar epimerase